MKFGQLIESNNKMFFFKNHAKKEGRETSSRPLSIL